MPIFQCDYCGKKFEAAKQRRFCSPEHRSQAFSNFYMALPTYTGYDGIISIKAPKGGWVRSTQHTLITTDGGFEVKIKVDSDGHTGSVGVRTLPHMQIPEPPPKEEKRRGKK